MYGDVEHTDLIGIDVEDGHHVSGVSNIVCDGLSRGKDPSEFGYSSYQCIAVESVEGLSLLLATCNPLRVTDSDYDFVEIWSCARRACQLLSEGTAIV